MVPEVVLETPKSQQMSASRIEETFGENDYRRLIGRGGQKTIPVPAEVL